MYFAVPLTVKVLIAANETLFGDASKIYLEIGNPCTNYRRLQAYAAFAAEVITQSAASLRSGCPAPPLVRKTKWGENTHNK